MPEADFDETLEQVKTHALNAGSDHVGNLQAENDDTGEVTHAVLLRHGGNHYRISGHEDSHYFKVELEHSAQFDYVRIHATDDHDLSGFPYEIPDDLRDRARDEVLQRIAETSPDDARGAYLRLIRHLSNGSTLYSLSTEDGVPYAFKVSTRIYPYTDSFDIEDVGRATREVVSSGSLGKAHLRAFLGMPSQDETGSDEDDEVPTDPGFR